ncbi:hypothetical protein [Amycolatopsis sp. NPDC003861]
MKMLPTMKSVSGWREIGVQDRPPSYKKPLNKWQSNFQWRATNKGKWKNNYHVDHRRWW